MLKMVARSWLSQNVSALILCFTLGSFEMYLGAFMSTGAVWSEADGAGSYHKVQFPKTKTKMTFTVHHYCHGGRMSMHQNLTGTLHPVRCMQ